MRTKKALINACTSIIYQLVIIVCGLITPRLILSTFGSTYNGVVSSATQFLEVISLLTLGLAGATRVALYEPLANNDKVKISGIMKSTKSYMHKVGFAVLAVAASLMLVYPLVSHNDLAYWESSLLIGIISLGTFAHYFFGLANQTLLMADQSNYISDITSIASTVLNTLLTVILIKCGCNIFVVKLGSSIVYFFSPFILNIYVKKKYSLDSACVPDDTPLKQRSAVMYHSIANIVHQNTDILMLTLFQDAKIISVYTVYYLVVGKIRTLLSSMTSGFEAALGNIWAKKEYDTLKKAFSGVEFICYSFSFVMFSCVAILLLPFIELYTSGVTDINYLRTDFAALVIIAEMVFCVRQPYLCLVQAAGFYNETKKGAVIEAVVNFTSSLILVNLIGLNGVIVGTLLANLIRTCQYAWFVSRKILKRSIRTVGFRILWLGIMFISMVFLLTWFVGQITISGWIGWIVKGFITFGIVFIVYTIFSLLFYKDDFHFCLIRFCSLINRKTKTNER